MSGKVTIIRATNGWILEEERHYEDEEGTYTAQEVFEDEPHENSNYAEAESLSNLLWSAFEHHFRSKWQAGMTIDVHKTGREEEFMKDYELRRILDEDGEDF